MHTIVSKVLTPSCATWQMEDGKVKCHGYWPPKKGKKFSYDGLSVRCVHVESGPHFVSSVLHVDNDSTHQVCYLASRVVLNWAVVMHASVCVYLCLHVSLYSAHAYACVYEDFMCMSHLSCLMQTLETVHIRFLGWADHGVPGSAEPFLQMVQEAEDIQGDSLAPMVVHCRLCPSLPVSPPSSSPPICPCLPPPLPAFPPSLPPSLSPSSSPSFLSPPLTSALLPYPPPSHVRGSAGVGRSGVFAAVRILKANLWSQLQDGVVSVKDIVARLRAGRCPIVVQTRVRHCARMWQAKGD